ncbi:hypothetical protein DFJ74DRAFT_168275 [Hyaloraphidium curvatum]|nr:hypothetical protein DFJ74DRAFT_168275 [Hyaloraphidium curvatum]
MPTSYDPAPFPYPLPGPKPPLPAPGSFLSAVRESCRAVLEISAPDISISDDAAIDNLIRGVDRGAWKSFTDVDPLRVPLKFGSLKEELGFVALLASLQIGSGYRKELKRHTGRGAAETITFGCFALFLSGQQPTSKWMSSVSKREVADIWSLPYDVEVPHESLAGVYVSQRSDVAGLVDLLHFLIHDLGSGLAASGFPDLASFVLDAVKPSPGARPKAARLVEALVTAFPGFQDMASWKGQPVYLFKRAQLLAAECFKAFRKKAPESFDFDDIAELTIFADNVVPTVLIAEDLIKISQRVAEMIERGADMGLPPEVLDQIDTRLRAAAVTVCERIVERAGELGFDSTEAVPMQVDYYLWKLGKEAKYRPLNRPVNKQTCMY